MCFIRVTNHGHQFHRKFDKLPMIMTTGQINRISDGDDRSQIGFQHLRIISVSIQKQFYANRITKSNYRV